MTSDACHCLAVRQAGRWITQLYDEHLAAAGLRSTQFAILSQLERRGPTGIAELAEAMVLDRTTLSRTVAPLERDGLVAIQAGRDDRRRRVVAITDAGKAAFDAARPHWRRAQAAFERHYGSDEAAVLRGLLRSVPHGRGGGAAAGTPSAGSAAR